MESNDKEKASCVSILKSLIAPEKGGMQVFRLERTYMEEIGSRIPHQKFGFPSVTAFLTSIPEISLDSNQMLHVRDPKMAHITAMVQAQRSNKTKKGSRSKRPMFQSGGRAPVRSSFSSNAFRPQSSSSRPLFQTYPSRPTASTSYKKPTYSVTQAKKPPIRYNAVQSLLGKMPTVEYVNGVAIHHPPTTQYNSNDNNNNSTGAYPKKPQQVESNRFQSSSPIKSYSPSNTSAARRPTVESASPARKTTIEYVNGIATTYIDGVEVKKAPMYSSPEPAEQPSFVHHNGETDTGANQKTAAAYANDEATQSGSLSLTVNGRRRLIARPSHAKAMTDLADGLSRTRLNEFARRAVQSTFESDWEAAGCSTSQQVHPDYASGDASTNGYRQWHGDQSQPSTSRTYSSDTPEHHADEWNAGSRQPMESQHQQSSSETRQLQDEAAAVQPTPVQNRLSKVHQRLKAINRHRERAEVVPAPPEAPHRSVVLQGGNGLLTISLDNAQTTDAAGVPAPAPPSDVRLEYETEVDAEAEKWKLELLKLTLRPMYAGYQLIGDNFFLGLAKSPEINAPCTALGGEDFRSGLCISGLTVLECNKEVFTARVISNKVMVMVGAMDILSGKSFTELKIQAIGLLEIMLQKSRVTSICLCTIPPLVSATQSQRECQLEFNKWLKGMVQGSRLFSCCDLFAKFLTLPEEEKENLYAKEATCIDVVDRFVEVHLWNQEGCAAVLDEFKKVCR